jgi:hypothetical protein
MCVHDFPTFKATQFAPLLNSVRKKFPGDLWLDTGPGRQAVHENFANGFIETTPTLGYVNRATKSSRGDIIERMRQRQKRVTCYFIGNERRSGGTWCGEGV